MTERVESREVHLVARPEGEPVQANFSVKSVAVRMPSEGELLVRNMWISVDPYMRNRMTAGVGYKPSHLQEGMSAAYVGAFQLDEPMLGGAVGEVIISNSPDYAVGEFVESMLGWREYAVGSAKAFRKVSPLPGVSLSTYLGALGMTGLTAYAGMVAVGQMRTGDAVFVSGAAGAVGSLACQLAKAHGCFVVGSSGSDAKCRWLEDVVGIDLAINYRTCGDLSNALAVAFPDGIDLHLANVGGVQLDAALINMANFGRVAISGFVESYNEGLTSPVYNLFMAVRRSLRVEGYTQLNHERLIPRLHEEVSTLITNGKISIQETVVEGIENAPQAFLDLFRGLNTGKMVVRVDAQG